VVVPTPPPPPVFPVVLPVLPVPVTTTPTPPVPGEPLQQQQQQPPALTQALHTTPLLPLQQAQALPPPPPAPPQAPEAMPSPQELPTPTPTLQQTLPAPGGLALLQQPLQHAPEVAAQASATIVDVAAVSQPLAQPQSLAFLQTPAGMDLGEEDEVVAPAPAAPAAPPARRGALPPVLVPDLAPLPTPEDYPMTTAELTPYVVDCPALQAVASAVGIRRTPALSNRQEGDSSVSWGDFVKGSLVLDLAGDEWLQMAAQRFLPMKLAGEEILRLATPEEVQAQATEDAQQLLMKAGREALRAAESTVPRGLPPAPPAPPAAPLIPMLHPSGQHQQQQGQKRAADGLPVVPHINVDSYSASLQSLVTSSPGAAAKYGGLAPKASSAHASQPPPGATGKACPAAPPAPAPLPLPSASRLTSTAGHPLSPFTSPNSACGCNACGKTQAAGQQMMSCRRCDFDICSECIWSRQEAFKKTDSHPEPLEKGHQVLTTTTVVSTPLPGQNGS